MQSIIVDDCYVLVISGTTSEQIKARMRSISDVLFIYTSSYIPLLRVSSTSIVMVPFCSSIDHYLLVSSNGRRFPLLGEILDELENIGHDAKQVEIEAVMMGFIKNDHVEFVS